MEREQEDKLVDEHASSREAYERELVLARGEEPLSPEQLEEMRSVGLNARGQMLAAIRMILDRETLKLDDLHYSEREVAALEALQTAVSGRGRLGEFVFAERRRELLEQALAELQPSMSRGENIRLANPTSQQPEHIERQAERVAEVPNAARIDLQTGEDLTEEFIELTEDIGELRERLELLEDAQEEIDASSRAAFAGELDEPVDKPADKPASVDPDAPKATTLTGPDRPDEPKPPSTLSGPDRPDEPKPPSSLVGPDRPDEPKPPSTVIDASSPPDATAKKSWWKRPFG